MDLSLKVVNEVIPDFLKLYLSHLEYDVKG